MASAVSGDAMRRRTIRAAATCAHSKDRRRSILLVVLDQSVLAGLFESPVTGTHQAVLDGRTTMALSYKDHAESGGSEW